MDSFYRHFIFRSLRVELREEAVEAITRERIHTENRQLQRRQLDKPNVSKFSVAYRAAL